MAGADRSDRLGAQIKKEISLMISRGDIKDPGVSGGMVTISEVKLSKDLRSAKIYVQIVGGKDARETAIDGMDRAAGFIRKQLASVLSVRKVPELRFVADESGERADKVMGLLAQIQREREAKGERGAGAPPEDGAKRETGQPAPPTVKASDDEEE